MTKQRAHDADDNYPSRSSQASAEYPRSAHKSPRMRGVLRRVPRATWLSLSAIVLVAGSVVWHWRQPHWDISYHQTRHAEVFSKEWWNKPWVRGADSALPDVSGEIYGIALQKRNKDVRVWIVGAGGLLANSEDNGQCWTRFEYDRVLGSFHEPKTNPCMAKSDITLLSWPHLVPTVLAAEPLQSKLPREQQQQQPSAGREQQQKQPEFNSPNQAAVSRETVTIFPTNIHFGDVKIPIEASPAPLTPQEFTVRNQTSGSVNVSVSGFIGDESGEFNLKQGCTSGLVKSGEQCAFTVVFYPKTAGPKQVKLQVQTTSAKEPVIVSIDALVHGPQRAEQPSTSSGAANPSVSDSTANPPVTGSAPKPSKPGEAVKPASIRTSVPEADRKPPSSPPDLLAIEFSPDGKIVSTGGLLWTLTNQNTWLWKQIPRGAREKVGGVTWLMAGSPTDKSATETRVESLLALDLSNERYQCGDCTIRSQLHDSETGTDWAAGWVTDNLGDHAIVFQSRDSGKSWEPITRGALSAENRNAASRGRAWMWPPNWYWAVLFLSLLLAMPALLPPPRRLPSDPVEAETGSVEGRLSSDKPLDPGDVDVLGLTAIALGLSRYLRNEKTLPPLTIAVNGEWGSGKSSLMNLLRCDLKSYGMRPVWFNAWHHQKEEHLLAALLQTVKLESVPPLWNLLGIPFRLKLLWFRVRRHWPLLVLLAAIAIFLIVADLRLRMDHQSDLFLWVTSQFLPSSSSKSHESLSTVPVQGGLIALVATIAALWKGLTAFGANPASLLASVAKGNKMKDLEAQTSFRQRFAVEFRDFTTALGSKRPLVIFIDDMDRCLPGNVRDVLEAVNFLVSSGDCFVVLGIDRVQVQRAIGLSFKEVAEEAGPKFATASDPSRAVDPAVEAARQKRAEFAQKYLEKLINLEVRIPLAIDDATKQRLFERTPERQPEALRERVLRSGLQVSKWGVPAALAVLLLIGAFNLSTKTVPALEQWMKENQAPPASSPETSRDSKSGPNVPSVGTASAENVDSATPAETKRQPALSNSASTGKAPVGELISPLTNSVPSILYGKEVWPARWVTLVPLYLALLFLLLVANVVLTTRPGVVTQDSQQFTDAMEKVWYPLVLAKQNTPRAAKRFVNRVRYLAMRQRGYQEQASWWERALFPQRLREPARVKDWEPIPEPVLVALAAVEQLQPDWVYDETAFRQVVGDNGIAELSSKFPGSCPDAAVLLERARAKHKETFSDAMYLKTHADWKSLPAYRNTFLVIWPRVVSGERP